MTVIFSVVGRVYMWERILGKATTLIKHFAAADNRIHRRIDFQNQSLAAFRQQIQRPPPITMVSQSLQNVKCSIYRYSAVSQYSTSPTNRLPLYTVVKL